MPVVNRQRTCWNGSVYCSINRTKCVQCGNGSNYICPICATEYVVVEAPKKLSPEEKQKIINRTAIGV